MKKKYTSGIAAVCHVSESEIYAYIEKSNFWHTDYAINQLISYDSEFLKELLYDLGIDITQPYVFQGISQHRNRMNQIVTCNRWFGVERGDEEWLNSGVASQAAIDRNVANPFLDELYARKGLTVKAQEAGEIRDSYVSFVDDVRDELNDTLDNYEGDK